MATDGLSDPGVIDRVDVDSDDLDPMDCLPPGETPLEVSKHPTGWIAVTERDLFVYRSERDPALVRVLRPNVTGLVVRRAGGESLIGYVPAAVLYAFAAVAVGVLLSAVSPTELIAVPDAPGVGGMATIVQTLEWASRLLGAVLVFSGILAGLIGAVVFTYWLFSHNVALVIERGSADPIDCPTDRRTGRQAIQELGDALSEE